VPFFLFTMRFFERVFVHQIPPDAEMADGRHLRDLFVRTGWRAALGARLQKLISDPASTSVK